jgi:hypothetical protein
MNWKGCYATSGKSWKALHDGHRLAVEKVIKDSRIISIGIIDWLQPI